MMSQKDKYFEDTEDEVSQFLVSCCLSVFSSQLCNVSTAEEFIGKGGLDAVLELITVPAFSKLCCAILEVTIIVELWRTASEVASSDSRKAMTSLQMLTDALESNSSVLISYLHKVAAKQLKRDRAPAASMASDSGCPTETTEDSSEQQDEQIATPNRKQYAIIGFFECFH
jgi:hypothetical protein